MLFSGANSPVCQIACYYKGSSQAKSTAQWEDDSIVAWADLCTVRIMDIATQTAICYLNAPLGVGVAASIGDGPANVLCPCPCSLFWESESDLLIAWADNFRHVRVMGRELGAAAVTEDRVASEGGVTAATLVEWQVDCLLCGGVFPVDAQHVMSLGYSPAEAGGADLRGTLEMLILEKSSGEVVSSDVLPLHWLPVPSKEGLSGAGPWEYSLLSSFQCRNGSLKDAADWDLRSYSAVFGGDRGKAPLSFVVAPHDLLLARVRDVNDRVSTALQQNDLKAAVEFAKADVTALEHYRFPDLLKAYLLDLLETHCELLAARSTDLSEQQPGADLAVLAASECRRLVGLDPALWEFWITTFIEYQQITALAPLLPLENPRLASQNYNRVLLSLLQQDPESSAAVFLQCVKLWVRRTPAVFDRLAVLASLEQRHAQTDSISSAAYFELPSSWSLLEAQAQLYIAGSEYRKALNCYLSIKVPDSWLRQQSDVTSGEEASQASESLQYRHVFELIEKQGLFSTVSSKIINLVRLSKPLSRRLLVSHVDKLPVQAVASQLAVADKRLLLWYLDAMFCDALEVYSSADNAEWHAKQVELYAEFAPSTPNTSGEGSFCFDFKQRQLSRRYSSPLLRFLQSELPSQALLQQVALPACASHLPRPLFHEMVFVLARLGDPRKALQLHLAELGDLAGAIDFIEEPLLQEKALPQQQSLWEDLVDHCLQRPAQLAQLLDYMGLLSTLNPAKVLARMPANTGGIPQLRRRLLRILQHSQLREFQHAKCSVMLEDDALKLLRQKNQGLRRAIKVTSSLRCSLCSRPLTGENPASDSTEGVVILSSKLGYHRSCYARECNK